MLYRQLGNSDLTVSLLGYGANNLGREGTASETLEGTTAVVNKALELGITYFDSADIYGREDGLSERLLGQALGDRREEAVIATKFGLPKTNAPENEARGSRGYIERAVEQSLKNLGSDYIDLYYYHSPDPHTPISETVAALEDLVEAGKIRYYGISNMSGWQTAEVAHLATPGHFVATQNHYNLIDRQAEQEILPASRHYGIGVVPYFPLAAGLLTGKYNDGIPSDGRLKEGNPKLDSANFDQLREFSAFCAARNLNEVQVAIAWLAHQTPVASIIAGATKPEQLEANAAAVDLELNEEDLRALDDIFPPAQKVAPF